MFSQSGKVNKLSELDNAFIALSISMTTKMLNETVDADCAISLPNIPQPINENFSEQLWKLRSWEKEICGPAALYMNHQA